MKLRHFSTQKGMTLVELLAALSLFAVLIALSSTVIIQMINSEEKTSENISLKQDTNVLISDLRNQYNSGESKLCFNKDKKSFTISNDTTIHNGQDILTINKNGCVDINNDKSVEIYLATENKGQQFSLKTTWANKKEYKVILEDDFNEEDFQDGNTQEQGEFNGNTKFEQDSIKKNGYTSIIVNGSAWFPNGVDIKQDISLTITKNLYMDEESALFNSVMVDIGKDATFKSDLTLKNKSVITINGDAYFYGDIIQNGNSGSICVKGESFFYTDKTINDYNRIFKCN
ncbi:type II secretion system protein [Virgibacillus litoralis]|uniref:Prepilin-type N-terminal cleavage/methylation domain-containing protein n=1 Tax=Virgibacillus litoralis TaxID=578221 RepID=A0ABS4HA66_9BACI|nr:type II secretion system protein [Virgibacillus litoralis]MBP1947791.1 prepilin-type N-terminal cleavage/methylation domain-containing protein [Virgibacillus litoralis]